jgi:16S rRNA (adenine1518-N6/adenine1519-N6)-dimethyltransferase
VRTDRARGHRARKRFGQHFLEPAWVAKVVAAIDPQPADVFLEIGPGHGALTEPLAARANHVVAYEIDRDLARELAATAPPNVQVVEGDFLATDDYRLTSNHQRPTSNDHIRVAGNLPYNIASPILFKLVDMHAAGVALVDATVMLQREVADRLLAVPGTKEYGVLTVLIRHATDVIRVLNLPPGAFRPAPKVHSTVVRLRFHAPEPPVKSVTIFRDVVQAVFTRRRKTLSNALRACPVRGARHVPGTSIQQIAPEKALTVENQAETGVGARHVPGTEAEAALRVAGIDGSRRPETLTVAEFARLADALSPAPRKT